MQSETQAMSVVNKSQLSVLASQLSEVERKLCEELVANPGIQRKDAGVKAGYSPKGAGPCVTRALKRPEVQAYLQALKSEIDNPGERKIRRKVMKAREVLARLSDRARSSLRPHMKFSDDGRFQGLEISEGAADIITHLKTRTVTQEGESAVLETEIKVADPMPALEALRKYHGLEKASPQGGTVNNNLVILGESEEGLEILRRYRALIEKGEGK